MTTPGQPTEAQRQRALRRRHQHERQTVIFGTITAGLVVFGLGAVAVYTGAINLPFDRPFSTPDPTAAAKSAAWPCLADGTLPVAYNAITVRVENGTATGGLAGDVAAALTERGFTVSGTGNYTPRPLAGTALVISGLSGVPAAYTLAAQIQGAELVLDTRQDASVDLAVGTDYTALLDPAQVSLSPDTPMTSAAGCVPADEITLRTPSATTTGTSAPTSATSG